MRAEQYFEGWRVGFEGKEISWWVFMDLCEESLLKKHPSAMAAFHELRYKTKEDCDYQAEKEFILRKKRIKNA